MMKNLLLAALLLTSLPLYAQKALTPIELNDKLTEITIGANTRGQEWGKAFSDAYQRKDYSALPPLRESIVRFVNTNIDMVTNMKDVNNSKPLRMAMLSFLRFERRLATESLQPFEKLTASSTPDEVKAVYDAFKKQADGEHAELEKIVAAQEAYAKENNFRIETEEEATNREGTKPAGE